MLKLNQFRKGQVSLEYLLILCAFFSAIALIIPIISFSTDQLNQAIDASTSKEIIQTLKENDELFLFLSNNSQKIFEFTPVKEINILINQKEVNIYSKEKVFKLNLNNPQDKFEKVFTNKFYLKILKENNKTKIMFFE